ncbi:YcxB family protein [Aureivirga marina]|uniref:YcxB family protein n=1 Tax=Aureivirga marina TaxID=1182451 RepID=UPI0018C9199B|nr:YcxB family protein [Aureivirga marina]
MNDINIHFQLKESDFLAYQMYESSISKLQKRKRMISRYAITLVYIVFALFSMMHYQKPVLVIAIVIVAFIWFLFYPTYSRYQYKNHFQKHIEAHFQKRINQDVEIQVNEEGIYTKDYSFEGKINKRQIKELIETKDHFFVRLTTELSLIIPKRAVENKREFADTIVNEFHAIYTNAINWKWS